MEFVYPFFVSFLLIFLSELGDKTQLLVLSFSTRDKAKNILLGVALGTLFSHGLAILFGSQVACLGNETFQFYLEIFTYISFILFGVIGFISYSISLKKDSKIAENNSNSSEHLQAEMKSGFLQKICNVKFLKNCIFIVAISIVIGELGDKTFLASLGLGIQYPNFKISLILGSIAGMVLSNSFALFFGKFISKKLNPNVINFLSNLLFIIFGALGFLKIFMD